MERKKVGLVLSGGAAYGFAHIGVLKVLEKNNIDIDFIAGTSMGAIIGGLYSSGLSLEEMEKILQSFSRRKFIDFNIFVLSDSGLLHGRKVLNILKKLVNNKKIEDCEKKFCCVASDLSSGEKYVFDKGDLATAIRASMSIPGIFKPVKIGHHCLVDGGVHDNIPVDEARKMGADIVIAVDVCSYYKKNPKLNNFLNIVFNATCLAFSYYSKNIKDKGDIYIPIEQPETLFDNFSYDNVKKSIEYGENMANKMLPEILEKIKNLK